MKTLYKSRENRVIAGVCGGISEYFGWDTSLVRIGTAVLCFCSGVGIIAYIVGAVVIPERPDDYDHNIYDMEE